MIYAGGGLGEVAIATFELKGPPVNYLFSVIVKLNDSSAAQK